MDITLRLLLVFYPGIICHLVLDKLTWHKERKIHEVFLHSYVLGIVSYLAFGLIWVVPQWLSLPIRVGLGAEWSSWGWPKFFKAVADDTMPADFFEILFVTVVSVGIAFIVAKGLNDKWLTRLGQRWGVTNQFGDANVWSFALNSNQVQWGTVRLVEPKVMYQGYIVAFSDVDEIRELLLSEVVAYNETTGKELYRADRIYVTVEPGKAILEIPNSPVEAIKEQ